MQRKILDSLTKAFPIAQFIVATHSPFIVSSVKAAKVYVLRYDPPTAESSIVRTVSSVLLDQVNMAGTASEILRDALGVSVTMPVWAEAELKSITSDYNLNQLTPESLDQLKIRLKQAGLGDFYPDALQQMAARH
jgi:Predicted ATP-binding protein involved in virulence